ncbi:MAG TPA: branched-chain amino acid ABC transporter substrate-binding protein [Candidatus Limnocylindrales bacterium]|nr:branched-chain amino acid ABC transporter substrate-binding protein [Candidatus Limnocylindrales bacterium]
MSRAFGDELLEVRLRAVMEERAEEVASRAWTSQEMTAELVARLGGADRAALRRRQLLRVGLLAGVLVLLFLAIALLAGGPTRAPLALRLAVDLPLGGAEPGTDTVLNAIQLAVRTPAGGGPLFSIEIPPDGVFNDAVAGSPDGARGADNMRVVAGDARNVAVIGPYNSPVAAAEIPVTNAAGVLECSPSNTAPGLTIGQAAAALRSRPDRPNYVRVATTDDMLAEGAARFVLGSLGKRTAYVIYAGGAGPEDPGTLFIQHFEGLGGTVLGDARLSTADDVARIAAEIEALRPEAIFDGGKGDGAGRLLDLLSPPALTLPFVGLDSLLDGPRSEPGSFLNLAGERAAHAFAVFPANLASDGWPAFVAHYRTAFQAPPAPYAVAGYACAEVILAALQQLTLPPSAGPADWREALRAAVTTPGTVYTTALGRLSFDANGDVRPASISVYEYDGSSEDWTFREASQLTAGP